MDQLSVLPSKYFVEPHFTVITAGLLGYASSSLVKLKTPHLHISFYKTAQINRLDVSICEHSFSCRVIICILHLL